MTDTSNLSVVPDHNSISIDFDHIQEFVQAFKSVAIGASTDNGREILTTVLFEYDGAGTVTLAATDSYLLVVAEIALPSVPDKQSAFSMMIPAKAGLAAMPKPADMKGHGDAICLTLVSDGSNVSFLMPGSDKAQTLRAMPGDFPNYRNLLRPENAKPEEMIYGVNPKYMERICKAAHAARGKGDQPMLCLPELGLLKPLTFKMTLPSVLWTGLLMPVRSP